MTSRRSRVRRAWAALTEASADLGGYIDADEDLYRRVSDTGRDLNPVTQARAREVSNYLWERNPMAKRIVEMIVDYVVGDGMTITAPDERVQAWVDDLWKDPFNGLEVRFADFVRDQSLNGELPLRMYTNETSGRSRLGYIDPERISRVQKDPEDMLIDEALFLRGPGGEDPVPLQLVRYVETAGGDPEWVGDSFYFPVNRPLTAQRGRPDLLALADWVDGYDQMLWNIVDRSGLQNAFIFDVTLEGSDDEEVSGWLQRYGSAPRPGTVRAHNEKEKWQTVTPTLGGSDYTDNARMIKNYALGGAGLPEGWFADGDSANRATLASQSDPTLRMLSRRQSLVKWQWETVFRVHVANGINTGSLPGGVDPNVDIQMADPSEKDVTKVSAALPQAVTAMIAAVEEEMISTKTARTVFSVIASLTGVDVDPTKEESLIEEERGAKEEAEAAERAAQGEIDQTLIAGAATGGEDVLEEDLGDDELFDDAEEGGF